MRARREIRVAGWSNAMRLRHVTPERSIRAECFQEVSATTFARPKLREKSSTRPSKNRRMPNSTPEAAMARHRIEAPTPCASPSGCRPESHADWGFRATTFGLVLPLRRLAIGRVPKGVDAFPPPRRGTSPSAFGPPATEPSPPKTCPRTTLDRRFECDRLKRPPIASKQTSLGGTGPGSTLRKVRTRAFPKLELKSRSKAPPHVGCHALHHLCRTTSDSLPAPTSLPLPAPMPRWRSVLLST